MKYAHPRNPDKVYYISDGWMGIYHIKEHYKGARRTVLDVDRNQLESFMKKLEAAGWIPVDF